MFELLIYLSAMVIIVPLSKRFGLGSVIGYLIAGALIGPQCFALLKSSPEEMSALGEFGVIMMLLLIGLELNPAVLWKMRGPIFGLGSLQVIGTTFAFTLVLKLIGFTWAVAVTVGMVLSVSSTAIVLQTLKERGYGKSVSGERAFAVLLFQDIAVIPMLAILPLLGAETSSGASSAWNKAALVLGAVIAVVAGGRFVIRPLFRLISRTKLRETFTALALLIVVGAATLMHAVGLSPALGAFLAGIVLADSEYRHQIEADIEPFKGLLLGVFFITVGAGINFQLVLANPLIIAGAVAAIVSIKGAVIYALGRWGKLRPPESLLFGISLAQGGEFAFVLVAQAGGILSPEVAQTLIAAVALSMAIAPLLIGLTITYGMSRLECATPSVREPDVVDEAERLHPVLVIGVGRFGQTMIRFLRANGIKSTVLDLDSEQIEVMARFGIKSYFGDGTNLDLLRAAGIETAQSLVIAIDEPESTTRIIEAVRQAYPDLKIFARVYDRLHAYKVLPLGVHEIAIETSGSALALGAEILKHHGFSDAKAARHAATFQKNNDRSIRELSKQYNQGDQEAFILAAKQSAEQLEAIFLTDPGTVGTEASSAWEAPPSVAMPTA